MINVYFNYPNSRVTIHQLSDCPRVHQHHSVYQRELTVNIDTLQSVLRDFVDGNFSFGAEAQNNDVWLAIDFNDLAFEIAIANFILLQLGKRYAPFDSVNPDLHC